jgi:hypothetical protein
MLALQNAHILSSQMRAKVGPGAVVLDAYSFIITDVRNPRYGKQNPHKGAWGQ